MSDRNARWKPATVLVATLALSAYLAPTALAAHDLRAFELDGNAANGGAAGADWATYFPGGGGGDVVASVFVDDGAAPPQDTDYYTSGGSKDTNDVTQWEHTDGDVAPDKNEITHAYAVAVRSPRDTGRTNEGDLIFYFGADRFGNSGDAQMGFWFFRGAVGTGSGSSFSGAHRVGDVLVLAHFTQGGRVGTAEVYRWVGSGGSEGSLDLIATGRECESDVDDEAVCSAANTGVVASPWSYEAKDGTTDAFPQGSFFEGGINMTRLLPGVECFSSYLAETRSSQSVDAQLKDLALGDFDTCPPPPAPKAPARADEPAGSTGTVVRTESAPEGPQLAASGPEHVSAFVAIGISLLILGCALRAAATPLTQIQAAFHPTRRRAGR